MQGWIKLHRSILENPFWGCEPFARGQAWIDLLLLANYERSFFFKRNVKVEVVRGQVARSEVELADRWKWSRTKVRKFLNDLEKEQQIIQHKTNVTQLITIVNYEKYQQKEQQGIQQKDSSETAEEQQRDILKKDKKNKEGKEDDEGEGAAIKLNEEPTPSSTSTTPTSDAIQSGYKPKVQLPTVDIMQEVLKESSDERYWINAVAEQHHLSQKQVRELIPKFVVHLASDGVTQKTTEDFKKHFNAWIRKKAEFGETSSSEIKPPNEAIPSSREKIRQMKELRNNFDFGDVGSVLAKQDRN